MPSSTLLYSLGIGPSLFCCPTSLGQCRAAGGYRTSWPHHSEAIGAACLSQGFLALQQAGSLTNWANALALVWKPEKLRLRDCQLGACVSIVSGLHLQRLRVLNPGSRVDPVPKTP